LESIIASKEKGLALFLKDLRVAVGFLTILPVGPRDLEPVDFGNSVKYFPLVGAVNGFIIWGLLWCFTKILPADIAAWLTVFGGAAFNGYIHWDGFADTADGLGGKNPQKRLVIMKDSRLGAFGTIALIFLILGKVLTISKLTGSGFGVFVCVATLSRWAMAFQIYTHPSVSHGLLRGFQVDARTRGHKYYDLGIATLLMFITLIFGWSYGLLLLGATIVILLGIYPLIKSKFGGITGDILGASNELVELVCLLILNLKIQS
jgi:adenosylcobinamide-GDP ribazoletransferase